jgi:hypothetical protein
MQHPDIPYAIIYRHREGIVTVVAFMHLQRKPDYWRAAFRRRLPW